MFLYCSLNELLQDGSNGLVFKDYNQLSQQLEVCQFEEMTIVRYFLHAKIV